MDVLLCWVILQIGLISFKIAGVLNLSWVFILAPIWFIPCVVWGMFLFAYVIMQFSDFITGQRFKRYAQGEYLLRKRSKRTNGGSCG